jgi:hypothetical protein
MTTFLTYRNGGGDLESRIKGALASFWQTRHERPAAVVVHKTKAQEGQELLKRLAPGSDVAVRGCGGCLVGEVWLEIAREGEVRDYEQ